MTNSIIKNIEKLKNSAENIWIPHWFEAFSNPDGGFYERLDKSLTPINMPRRLLSQCRQMIVYSMAHNRSYHKKLDETFQFIKQHYFNEKTGGSIFSLNNKNQPEDTKYDLYAHAFIILACAEYYKETKNKEALNYAKTTLHFIDDKFRLDIGFAEALDKNLKPISSIRRQNPHMHLLEGCMAMFKASKDNDYKEVADEVITLFFDRFFDHKSGTLGEFFDNDLNPHPTEGHKIEAGHHGEWVWLLSQYQQISDKHSNKIEKAKERLFDFVINHGIDKNYSGIFNVQDRNGNVIDDNKRIWTAFEVLRASFMMRQDSKFTKKAEKIMSDLLNVIQNNYIDPKTGNWHEILDKNLKPITDYLPATTPYHIYPILRVIN